MGQSLLRIDLIILDEPGYLPFSQAGGWRKTIVEMHGSSNQRCALPSITDTTQFRKVGISGSTESGRL